MLETKQSPCDIDITKVHQAVATYSFPILYVCHTFSFSLSDDVATSKLLLGCLLKLSTQMKSLPQLMRDIMQDLHTQLGDIDRV